MNSLVHSLQDHPPALLRAIADVNGIALPSNAVRTMVDQIATTLSDSLQLLRVVATLSDSARQGLDDLLAAGGSQSLATFERRYGAIRPFGPGRLEREQPQRTPANASEELWYHGLVYRAFAQTPAGPVEFLYVPDDLARLLPRPAPTPTGLRVPVAAAPARLQPTVDETLHDMCTLLCLVQAGRVRLRAADEPLSWQSKSLYEFNTLLLHPAPQPQDLTGHAPGSSGALALTLAVDLGWLRADGGRLRLDAAAVRQWLDAPRGEQRRTLCDAWRGSARWNDLCRTPALWCEDTGSWQNDPTATRERLLPLLAGMPAGAWLRVADFVSAVRQQMPEFQRSAGDFDTWYVRQRHAPVFLRGFEAWNEVEGALLRFLIAGPWHWLGAVDLGYESEAEPGGAPASFRWTPAGSAWLADEPAASEETTGRVQVMSDFTVIVPADAPLRERFRVARFTTWMAGGPPFRCRITQSGLRRAAAQRIEAAQILAYLRAQAGPALPDNVVRALERWQAAAPARSEHPAAAGRPGQPT